MFNKSEAVLIIELIVAYKTVLNVLKLNILLLFLILSNIVFIWSCDCIQNVRFPLNISLQYDASLKKYSSTPGWNEVKKYLFPPDWISRATHFFQPRLKLKISLRDEISCMSVLQVTG